MNKDTPVFKFNEDLYVEEIYEYIADTYDQHYAKGEGKRQTIEGIIDAGHGTGFCVGNVIKYAERYGNKGTKEDARKDLMKVIHYAILQLHIHDSGL